MEEEATGRLRLTRLEPGSTAAWRTPWPHQGDGQRGRP
jgi:hypothetical protein